MKTDSHAYNLTTISKNLFALFLFFAWVAFPSVSNASYTGGECKSISSSSASVTVHRMKWQYGLNLVHASGFGPHFSNKGIPDSALKDMYIAKVWEPAPSQVKNIVILSAGQHDPFFLGGVDNGVTGQTLAYRWGAALGPTRSRKIVDNSMARKVMDKFDPADTALMLVFDSQFNFLSSDSTKEKIKHAFRDWIYSLADDPKLLYFAGSSRGGALALSVGTALTNSSHYPKFNDTLFAIQGIDPVFRPGEYGVTSFDKIRNPFNTSWKAHELDIRGQFNNDPSRIGRTMIKIITTGDKVALIAEGALPWGEWSTGAAHSGDLDASVLHIYDTQSNAFYEGNWVAQEHISLGRNYCTGPGEANNQISYRNNAMLHHLDNVIARQACDANGRWNYSCNVRYGCPASSFQCICDAGYVPNGSGACELSCPPGQAYDAGLDQCVDKCSIEDNEIWDEATQSCQCTAESNWSLANGCVTCDQSDWNPQTASCCPSNSPNYSSTQAQCYPQCSADSYWQFPTAYNPGRCVDYCPPCENPEWDVVCDSKEGKCRRVMMCRPQCDEGEECATSGRFSDICSGRAVEDIEINQTPGLNEVNAKANFRRIFKP